MFRIRIIQCFLALLMVSLLSGPMLFAHEGDPKLRDRQPRYEGLGFARGGYKGKVGPEFPAEGLVMQSWVTIPEFEGTHSRANDCWGYTAPSGREYALIGLQRGTGFVEVTDPTDPRIVDVIDGVGSTWRDVKTYGHHAYVVSEGGGGLQVIDMSQIDNNVVTLVREVTSGGTTATHNVAIDTESGFLYRTGGSSNGLRIYDLSDPGNPTYITSWTDRYVHDAQIVTYTEGPYAGRQIAFACAGFNGGRDQTGLSIVDVTDKQNMQVLTHYQFSNPNYSHQGWLSEDRNYFYLNDELDEANTGSETTTRVIDVSDLLNPFEAATFTNGSRAIDHNLYTHNGYIFESNYRSGLRVFSTCNPLAPNEIAYFDTYPDSDSANFNGLWSVYPYFPSGTIIGSDIEKGLFVWRMDPGPKSLDYDLNQDCLLNQADRELLNEQWRNGCRDCLWDLDRDGIVTVEDMVLILNSIAR